MVNWSKVENRISGVKVETVDAKSILDIVGNPTEEELAVTVPLKSFSADASFDLKRLMYPLGDYWRVMVKNEDFQSIRDALLKYWAYKGMPRVRFEFADMGGVLVQLREKVTIREDDGVKVIDLNKIIEGVNGSFDYDRTVIGSDGSKLEFQFLSKRTRKEVLPGDFVDGGLFVAIDGQVRISAGLNRLVCTNGLTERLNVMSGTDFSGSEEILQRAVNLINWLSNQTSHKVNNVRELSVALKDFPEFLLNRFWKGWSEKIDLKELTWFDVIDSLTREGNKTLSNFRYRMLESYETINTYQTAEHRCPICSATVGNGK